jgi:hypothetical protein
LEPTARAEVIDDAGLGSRPVTTRRVLLMALTIGVQWALPTP